MRVDLPLKALEAAVSDGGDATDEVSGGVDRGGDGVRAIRDVDENFILASFLLYL